MRRLLSARVMFALAFLIGLGGGLVRGQSDEDLAKELPRIKAFEPDEALKSFRLHPGFRIEAVAVEPIVTDPVSVVYDADGRIYAVEMRGYPYPEETPHGNVRRLEDRDDDGVYERSTIFVDGLSWPTGVACHDGGVFITVAPDILFAKDTDGDGVADIKKVMFTGFGKGNVQALVNGLQWGLDGWIYGVSAANGGEITNLSRPDSKAVSVRGRDFRFKPDGSAFEATSGGGQFGHGFDDWGHRFTCSNSNHIRQIVLPARYLERNPALMTSAVIDDIAAEGPASPVFRISSAEPWRIVRTRQRASDPDYVKRLPPTELVATGFFTSATGVTIYRGTAFPPEYRGNAFIGDVGGNLVHRKILTPDGAEFRATRADQGVEFLASTDNWFRPVNFANTPDGTLLILDMYRETIEHPFSIPEPIKKHLDLTSGRDRGRLYHLIPDGFQRRKKPALTKAGTEELVNLLADPDAWWRETAQRLLIERDDSKAIPLLKALARDRPNPLARSHAAWTLHVLGNLDAPTVVTALKDPDARVREQAARLSEGRIAVSPVVLDGLLELSHDDDPMVRFQAAFSMGEVEDPRAIPALAAIAVRDSADRWTRAAVLSSAGGRPLALFNALVEVPGFQENSHGRAWFEDLAELIGVENRPEQVQSVLNRVAGEDVDPGLTRAVVLGLGRGLQRSGGAIRDSLEGPNASRLASIFTRAAEVASGDGPEAERVEAIQLLGQGPIDEALKILPDWLDARQSAAIQLATLQTLADFPDDRVGTLVTDHWKALSPSVRREAIEVLFARPDRLTALLDAVHKGEMAVSDLDPARIQQLRQLKDPILRKRALESFGAEVNLDRRQALERFRDTLKLTGHSDKGRALFKKVCATCHKAETQGIDVGPNLATITGRTPEDLLIHILDPNREIQTSYINYNVATTDGRTVSGIIADESANAVTLKRAEGVTETVPRKQIEEIASTGLSLMPEGLEKGLDPQDMADLIAYLRSLQITGQVPTRAR